MDGKPSFFVKSTRMNFTTASQARGLSDADMIRRTAPLKQMKPTRGGKREGAGRKPGRKVVSGSVTMEPALWAKLDKLTDNRSAWIAERVKRARG